jgi:hypothetical protein
MHYTWLLSCWCLAAKKKKEKIESLNSIFILFYFMLILKLRFSFIYLFIICLLLTWPNNGGLSNFRLPYRHFVCHVGRFLTELTPGVKLITA